MFALLGRDFAREPAVDRVVLQQVRECAGVDQVVDRHHLDVRVLLVRGTQDTTPDAAESVDGYSYWHQNLGSWGLATAACAAATRAIGSRNGEQET